jgi:hypothetical protein
MRCRALGSNPSAPIMQARQNVGPVCVLYVSLTDPGVRFTTSCRMARVRVGFRCVPRRPAHCRRRLSEWLMYHTRDANSTSPGRSPSPLSFMDDPPERWFLRLLITVEAERSPPGGYRRRVRTPTMSSVMTVSGTTKKSIAVWNAGTRAWSAEWMTRYTVYAT